MAVQHIPKIVCSPGAENEFAAADQWIIDGYTAGDWNGALGNPSLWHSDAPGTQAEIVAPDLGGGAGPEVSYFEAKDINNTGALILANDGTSIDNQNNSGIRFHIAVSSMTPSGRPGTTFIVSGNSFLSSRGSGKVEFKDGGVWVEAASYSLWNNQAIHGVVPVGAGTVDVKITNNYGETKILANAFTFSGSNVIFPIGSFLFDCLPNTEFGGRLER